MPKPAYTLSLLLAALAVTITGPSQAHAQRASALDEPYIAAKLTLGFGGSATTSYTGPLGTTTERDRNLQVAVGVAGQYVYPLHEYFSVGGLFGIQTWRSTADGDGGRNIVFDLAVFPQGKYELIANKLELNVSLPIGLAMDLLNEVDARSTLFSNATGAAVGGTFEGNTALGLVVGFLVGARYQLLDDVGLLVELGYLYRTVGHTLTPSVSASNGSGGIIATGDSFDVGVSWGQFALNLGAYF
jgi:hypothetical protein